MLSEPLLCHTTPCFNHWSEGIDVHHPPTIIVAVADLLFWPRVVLRPREGYNENECYVGKCTVFRAIRSTEAVVLFIKQSHTNNTT